MSNDATILAALMKLQSDVEVIKSMLARTVNGAPAPSNGSGYRSSGEESVASDEDLDGDHGDPEVRKDPTAKYWQGPSFVGERFSRTASDYLDAMAKYKDACAHMKERDGGEAKLKYAGYDRRDAARARGWAARLRARDARGGGGSGGRHMARDPGPAGGFVDNDGTGSGDDDIPFITCSMRGDLARVGL